MFAYRYRKNGCPVCCLEDVPSKRICVIQIGRHVSYNSTIDVLGDCCDDGIRVGYGPGNGIHRPPFQVDVMRIRWRDELLELDLKMHGADLAEAKELGLGICPLTIEVEIAIMRPDHGVGLVEGHVVQAGSKQCAVCDHVSKARQSAHADRFLLAGQAWTAGVVWVGDTLEVVSKL